MVFILTDNYLEAVGWEQNRSSAHDDRWELWTGGVLVAWMEFDRYRKVSNSCGVNIVKGNPVLFKRIDRVRGKR